MARTNQFQFQLVKFEKQISGKLIMVEIEYS